MTTERIADHVKFAYWVPNVSGGLVTSDIEQRTDWNYDYNAKLAQTAESNGFEYALSQVRYEASYGAEYQHESTAFSPALLLATQKLRSSTPSIREIFQGGNSTAARRNGGRHSDWYFSNGKDLDGVTEQVVEVRDQAREVRFGLNGFIIARDSEKEAKEVLREIIDKANRPAVEGFHSAVQQAGNSTSDKRGMWADSTRCGVPQTRCRPDPRRLPALPGRDHLLRLAGTAAGAGNRRFRTGFDRFARLGIGLSCRWPPPSHEGALAWWSNRSGQHRRCHDLPAR